MPPETTEKQQAILDATLELIGERGFHGTPMSAIADRAGVGAGTIYRYYASKDDLINALYVREKGRINAQILAGYRPDMPTREAMLLMWRNALETRACQEGAFRFLEQYYNSPFIGDDTRRVREQMMREYLDIIERGVKEGVLRDLPRPVILSLMLGPVANLATAARLGDIELDDAMSRSAFEAVWRSIAVD